MWVDYWGGAKGYVGPPSQIIGGGLAPPGPPSSYAYDLIARAQTVKTNCARSA